MARGPQLSSRILDRYILTGERIVVATRHHWGKILEPVATTVVAFAVVGLLAGATQATLGSGVLVLWLVWLAVVVRMLWLLLEWRNEWFVATDKRLLLVYGLITHKVAMMPLGKVTDMNYARSPLGRVLGYGQFLLESAGQDQALRQIDWVAHPDATYRKLCDTLFRPDGADHEDDPDAEDTAGSREPAVVDEDLDTWGPAAPPSWAPLSVPPVAREVVGLVVPPAGRGDAEPPAARSASSGTPVSSAPTRPVPTGADAGGRTGAGGVPSSGGVGRAGPGAESGAGAGGRNVHRWGGATRQGPEEAGAAHEPGWVVSGEHRGHFVPVGTAPPRHRADPQRGPGPVPPPPLPGPIPPPPLPSDGDSAPH